MYSVKMSRVPYEPVSFPSALVAGLTVLVLPRLLLARLAVRSRVLQLYFLAIGLGQLAVLLGFHGSGQGAMLFVFLAIIDFSLSVPATAAVRVPATMKPVLPPLGSRKWWQGGRS